MKVEVKPLSTTEQLLLFWVAEMGERGVRIYLPGRGTVNGRRMKQRLVDKGLLVRKRNTSGDECVVLSTRGKAWFRAMTGISG